MKKCAKNVSTNFLDFIDTLKNEIVTLRSFYDKKFI